MSVNKVQLANGETIIDISDSTVTPETLAEGVTAHDASGQKITGKMVPGDGASVQTDWNQTDETAPDFLKNKPFCDKEVVILEETQLTPDESGMCVLDTSLFTGTEQRMIIVYDGARYECDVDTSQGYPMFLGGSMEDPLFILVVMVDFDMVGFQAMDGNPHNVAISKIVYKQLEAKYAPKNKTRLYFSPPNDGEVSYITHDLMGDKIVTTDELQAIVLSDTMIEVCDAFNNNYYCPMHIYTGSPGKESAVIINMRKDGSYTTTTLRVAASATTT